VMNAQRAMFIDGSVGVYVDGNYIGVPLGDDDCTTSKGYLTINILALTIFSLCCSCQPESNQRAWD